MFNTSIVSLHLFSIISASPLYMIQSRNKIMQTSFCNSKFSRSFNNIIYSSSNMYKTTFKNVHFSYTLSSALYINSENQYPNCLLKSDYEYKPNEPIGGETITGFTSKFTDNSCQNITITGCTFKTCSSTSDGGALSITSNNVNTFVIIHNTIFDDCSSESICGGACFIVSAKKSQGKNFADDKLQQLDIQYCCYENCHGSSSLYGCALFSAAQNTVLLYASTVNCPGQKGGQIEGAQFDLQTEKIDSSYVNATGANAVYCGGIEYRGATAGTFTFQTISHMTCMFAVSYSNIQTKDLTLGNSNIQNIKLIRSAGTEDGDELYSGLIHVRYYDLHSEGTDIIINSFCFINNEFNTNNGDKSRIVSRGTFQKKIKEYKVILNNCFYDCSHDNVAVNDGNLINFIQTKECNENTETLNEIAQLKLDQCMGEVTAAPLTPTPSETPDFTESKKFSYSNYFTKSSDFSKSKYFSETDKFTKTSMFSESNEFTNTDSFTKINSFSETGEFTQSSCFSNSDCFTLSETMNPVVDREPVIVPEVDPDDSNDDKKNSTAMIAGVSAAAAAVVIAAILAAFFIIKKKRATIDEEDIETLGEDQVTINRSNPIYDNKAEDDPFKVDFN